MTRFLVPTPSTKKTLILIVEDDHDTAASLTQLLQSSLKDSEIVAKTSIADAKQFLETRRPDAILVDYRMPEQNGVDFIAEIHETRPDLPAVLMTALPDPQILARAVNKGRIQGLFLKPLDLEQVIETVQRILPTRPSVTGRIPYQPPFGRWERADGP